MPGARSWRTLNTGGGEADREGMGCCGRFSLSVWPLPAVWMVDRSF